MTELKKWFYIPWITTFLFDVFSLYEIIFLDFNKFRRILNLFRIFSFFELIFLGSFNEFFRIWNLWDVCSLFEIILFGSFNGIKFIGPGASLEVRQPSICLRQILRIASEFIQLEIHTIFGSLAWIINRRYSLISIRQNYNFDMLAMIWHEIVCWFLKIYQAWFL